MIEKVNEQFARTKRWLKRFEEISDGRDHTRESDYYEDIVYSFFQNCFHLKDWIINLGFLNKTILDQFIESSTDMKICRDLCNGSKHLRINHPSIDSNVHVNRREYSITLGIEPTKIQVIYWVHADGRTVDAFNLATSCVATWESFLKSHNLFVENFSPTQQATTNQSVTGKARIVKNTLFDKLNSWFKLS